MKIKGIKRGKNIEILEPIDIPDGAEITLKVDAIQLFNEQERLKKLNNLFGAWSNQPDLDEIFVHIDRQRHIDHGRDIDIFEI